MKTLQPSRPAILSLVLAAALGGNAVAAELPIDLATSGAAGQWKMLGLVCEDAGAGAYEAFPDVCRLSDGRLMAVFYAGYGHVAMPNAQLPKGGRVSYCTSADEGHTWSKAEVLYDGPDDDRDPSIVQLKDGRLICNFFSLRKTEGKSPPWTGLGTWMVASTDLGRTWSAPQQISAKHYCSSPIREISGGRLVLGLYQELPKTSAGAVAISDDGAKTWRVVDIPTAASGSTRRPT